MLRVEEVVGAEVVITPLDPGVDAADVDGGFYLERLQVFRVELHRGIIVRELASDVGDAQVPHFEADL